MFVVLGSKVPAPPLQIPPVAMVKEPFRLAAPLLAQSVWSLPALAVGAAVIVKVTSSLTALQVPLPTVVSVRVTVPAVRSAALGVYTAFRVALFGAYVPVPPLHTAPVAPIWLPARVIAELFAQTVPFGPASTVGAGVNVIVLLLDTGL